jgi:glycosyltransferase involved in cell wall biosynthesis
MKVHLYGNVLNLAFITTKMLRAKGVDAILFLDNTSPVQQDYPWWDDPSINKGNLPNWIKYYDTFPIFAFPNKTTRKMISDFSECDVAFVSCFGPIVAMKAKVPFVFVSAGSDLNMIDLWQDIKVAFNDSTDYLSKFKKLIKIIFYSPLQKKAIVKHCDKILIGMGFQYNNYIKKFKLEHKTSLMNLPKDINDFNIPIDDELNQKYKKYKVVYFMLSRHSWFSVWNEYKGNDKFIKAYAQFYKEYQPNALFICSTKGIDIIKSKELVKELGIENAIEWVDDMPKYILKKYQSLKNMVMIDNFWHDQWFVKFPADKLMPKVGFGFGSVESLAAKRPLLTSFTDYEFYNNEEPPILKAFTINEIYNKLVESYTMTNDELNELGEKGFQFVTKWYDNNSPNNKILDFITTVYEESKL